MAVRQTSAVLGTLTQEIPLNPFLPGAAYLLSFAASSPLPASVTAQLIWLNALGNPIGSPGIDATIAPNTLAAQDKYLSFVQLSGPEPIGAVRARLIFTALGAADSQLDLDKVILVRFAAPNLIQNPGFASGLAGWISVNVTPQNTGGYVGQNFAEFFNDAALINQTVALPFGSACRCFLLNFALHYSGAGGDGNVLAQVRWLDARGNDIGLGPSFIVSQPAQSAAQWQVYTGFTERVPPGAASAIIQFTKSAGLPASLIGLDSVIFARVD